MQMDDFFKASSAHWRPNSWRPTHFHRELEMIDYRLTKGTQMFFFFYTSGLHKSRMYNATAKATFH